MSQNKLFQASELLGWIVAALVETHSAAAYHQQVGDLNHSGSSAAAAAARSNELVFVPVSGDLTIACPEWKDDFFMFPFAFVEDDNNKIAMRSTTEQQQQQQRRPPMITEQMASTCTAACLFNLGLCCQLEGREQRGAARCTHSFRRAIAFYEQAWVILHRFAPESMARGNNMTFLLMALCTNLSKCYIEISELEASNIWLAQLRKLLLLCWQPENDPKMELLHNFFHLTSATTTGYVAAGTA
ncbi:hypothetical protein ACA910_015461 [Epithemia clementina (nom. ined.)]